MILIIITNVKNYIFLIIKVLMKNKNCKKFFNEFLVNSKALTFLIFLTRLFYIRTETGCVQVLSCLKLII